MDKKNEPDYQLISGVVFFVPCTRFILKNRKCLRKCLGFSNLIIIWFPSYYGNSTIYGWSINYTMVKVHGNQHSSLSKNQRTRLDVIIYIVFIREIRKIMHSSM